MPKNSKVILVPDIHQNIAWFKRIIKKEGHDAHYVLMGDYFDARGEEATDDLEGFCLEFGKILSEIHYEALIGNHDALYFERERNCEKVDGEEFFGGSQYVFEICGVSSVFERTRIIKKNLPQFLKSLKPYTTVGEYLVSHAGFNKRYFDNFDKIDKILDRLYYNTVSPATAEENHIVLAIGRERGGRDIAGGILWQDLWEFRDDTPQQQIFAHNRKQGSPVKIGRSWMIDMAQTYYGAYDKETKVLTFEKV